MPAIRRNRRRSAAARISLVALAVGIVLGGAGCGKASEKVSEKAAEKAIEREAGGKVDIDVDDDSGKVKVKTKDGSFSAGGEKVPDAWPDDVPLPKDLSGISATESSTDAQVGIQIQGETSLSTPKVLALYENGLKGWEADSASQSSGSEATAASANYTKGQRQVSVYVNDIADATSVSLTYTDGGSS